MSDPSTRPTVAPLTVDTDLSVRVNGVDVSVESTGERLFVGVASVGDALRAARGHPRDGGTALAEVLDVGALTVEFRVRDRTVAVAGTGASPGPVSRRLGSDPIELRLGGVLGAIGAELSAFADALR